MGNTTCTSYYAPLEEAVRSAEKNSGKLMVSGRYHRHPRKLEDDYITFSHVVLGSGYNGTVVLAASRHDQSKQYAIKTFKLLGLSKEKKEELVNETEIILRMDYPHIIRLVDAYESSDRLSLVMELMAGGELYDRVRERKRFSEGDAAVAVYQMLLAVNYLHHEGIAHRDLKLENFMYESTSTNHLKLIDFGFSSFWEVETKMRTSCGTLSYVAPEVLMKSYTPQCDMWSLGVIAWILLVGYMPFSGPDRVQIQNIKAGNYKVKKDVWAKVSSDAQDFVFALLKVDPVQRLTSEKALAHRWIRTRNSSNTLKREQQLADDSLAIALLSFARQSQFKRACFSMMAWSLSAPERAQVRDAFVAMDPDHTGVVKLSALKEILVENFELPDEKINDIVHALDYNNDEELNYSEFLAAMVSTRIEMHDDLLMNAFRRFDTDGTGYITVEDLRKVLGESFDGATVEELLREADMSGRGKIFAEEFISYLKDPSENATTKRKDAAQKLIDDQLSKSSSGNSAKNESPFKIRHRTKVLFNSLRGKVMTTVASKKCK
mmetsp:Transcript_56819/g.133447  ORF Transcript_56819/g.133447 Transcript_56819/m.133447 type:complete len:548 (+) Transcript_56819:165-1808(+)